VTLGGVVTVFPNKDATDVPLADGGTVTFFSLLEDGGVAQVGPTPIVMAGSFPSYSLTVPVGTWTALVQETGVVLPTYFPGLQVRASQLGGSAQLSLNAVVDIDVVGFPAIAGITPQAGHVYWVGLASNCSLTNYVGDYTLGLSPAPPGLGYLSSGLEVDPGLSASSSSVGEFFAEDAPYAPTQYAMAINGGTGTTVLLNGTFVPPQYSPGQDIAVALIYPNFTP
jgi:hypothetical protein